MGCRDHAAGGRARVCRARGAARCGPCMSEILECNSSIHNSFIVAAREDRTAGVPIRPLTAQRLSSATRQTPASRSAPAPHRTAQHTFTMTSESKTDMPVAGMNPMTPIMPTGLGIVCGHWEGDAAAAPAPSLVLISENRRSSACVVATDAGIDYALLKYANAESTLSAAIPLDINAATGAHPRAARWRGAVDDGH